MTDTAHGGSLPTIVLRDSPPALHESVLAEIPEASGLCTLLALVADSGVAARQGVRSLMRALIEEGRRYALTPAGQRWTALLNESPAITNGWLLWNQCNADFYLRNAQPLGDSPATLLEDMLQELKQIDLTDLVGQLSRLAAQMDADRQTAREDS
jgi:hypothetical protein